MGKVDPVKPGTIGGGGGQIRPLYGVFIGDELVRFRSSLEHTMTVLSDAIENGDRDIQGKKDRRLADGAIKALAEALEELRIGDPRKGGVVAKAAAARAAALEEEEEEPTPRPIMRPLYGVFITTQVGTAIKEITALVTDIKAAVKAKAIPAGEEDDVKRALKDLSSALKKLDKIRTN